jgi:hypothetical protein
MGILKAVIEDMSGSVLKMEKSSILDYVKRMPGTALNQAVKHGETKTGANLPTQEKAKLQHELRRLDALEQKIEEEKVLLKKEIGKEKK